MSRKSLVPIELPADPANNLEAAPKQYVDGKATQAAGGDLTGNYPNPTLSSSVVQALRANVQDEGIDRALDIAVLNFKGAGVTAVQDSLGTAGVTIPGTPVGSAGGDLTGTYPDPEIGAGKVTSTELASGSVYQAHIVNGEVTLVKLSATGTPSGTTYLRGDNTWATPAGAGGGSLDSYTAVATSGINPLTATVTDIPGCTATVASGGTTEKFLVNGSADLAWVSGSPSTAIVGLWVDSSEWVDPATTTINQIILSAGALIRVTPGQHWLISGLSAGNHTFRLRGSSTTGGVQVRATHTKLTVVRLTH